MVNLISLNRNDDVNDVVVVVVSMTHIGQTNRIWMKSLSGCCGVTELLKKNRRSK